MRVTPNFKDAGKPQKRQKEGRDPEHLKFLRTLPCLCTGRTDGIVAHHLLMKQLRGMGKRAPDWYAVPLHAGIHDMLHAAVPKLQTEEEFFLGFDVKRVDLLAPILWQVSGDFETADMLLERWGSVT